MMQSRPFVMRSGLYRLAGSVKDGQDNPLAREVMALAVGRTGTRRRTRSDPTTGEWQIQFVPDDTYMVIARDETREFQAEAFDYSHPVPME